jgi:hypothetical protein
MDAIVTLLVILILSAFTFMYTSKKERKLARKPLSSELDYLYTYKGILQKVAQIELNMSNIEGHPYFRSIEISFIKQQMQLKMKTLTNNYSRGLVSALEVHNQLDELNNRIHVLFFSVAA